MLANWASKWKYKIANLHVGYRIHQSFWWWGSSKWSNHWNQSQIITGSWLRQQTNQITLLEWGKGHALTPRNNELLFARINPYKNSRCIQGCHLLLMSNIPCKHIVSKRVYNFLATGLAILWIGLSISILVIRTWVPYEHNLLPLSRKHLHLTFHSSVSCFLRPLLHITLYITLHIATGCSPGVSLCLHGLWQFSLSRQVVRPRPHIFGPFAFAVAYKWTGLVERAEMSSRSSDSVRIWNVTSKDFRFSQ